jgi:hypothetical protein
VKGNFFFFHFASYLINLLRDIVLILCSLDVAIARLREEETISKKPSQNLKVLETVFL